MKYSILFLFQFLCIAFSQAQTEKIYSFQTDQFGGPSKTIQYNGKLYFSAYDSIVGRELYSSDGTVSGTVLVKDINPGISNGLGDYFEMTAIVHNGILYFRASDGVNGFELWRTDGTAAGTYLVKDINPGPGDSNAGEFASAGNLLFFTVYSGTQLWRSDGTLAGTYSIATFLAATNLTGYNGKLYFSADQTNNGQELWKSNGTPGGTVLLKDLNGVIGTSLPCNFMATPSSLYFTAITADGWELWKTDGTNGGTIQVADINPGPGNGVLDFYSVVNSAVIGDTIFFRANDGNGYQLWKSDGTLQGTVKLSNLSGGIDAYNLYPVTNGKVMVGNYLLTSYWQYDSNTGTGSMSNYPFYNYFNSYTNKNIFTGNKMLYAGSDSLYGPEVWISDGSINGNNRLQETHLVNNWYPGGVQGFNSIFGMLGAKILFIQARNPYTTDIPLFVYDTNSVQSCYSPSLLVPVPVTGTSAGMVWNRTDGAINYQLIYKPLSSVIWDTCTTSQSFTTLQNLADSTEYDLLLRSDCGGGWGSWSDTLKYTSSFSRDDYGISILAEREVDSTTVKIFWLKTPQISQAQFRYRRYGTTAWQVTNNATGIKTITGLQPSSLYEYQYRVDNGGGWGSWYPSSLYFNTTGNATSGIQQQEYTTMTVYPNPAHDFIYPESTSSTFVSYTIYDLYGKIVQTGTNDRASISIISLPAGIYFLLLVDDAHTYVSRFVKN